MSKRTLLVITTGQTDVQLVERGLRHELDKKKCATLHDQIEKSVWRLVDTPLGKERTPVAELPIGDLALCVPKLDAVLRHLRSDESEKKAALVFETRRAASSEPGDPRFAGGVMERRLRESGFEVRRVAYMSGAEKLEDSSDPRDAVIRREIVRRLESAVSESLGAFHPTRIVVAATGGLPKLGDLVEDVVRLHADVQTEEIEIADMSRVSPAAPDEAQPRNRWTDPALSFRARARAQELIGNGNLFGAWAVAEQFASDGNAEWVRVVNWLYCFASSLPMPEDCDIEVLTRSPRALKAAMRVEFALRARDVPRAIHGTVAFFESALWDHLDKHVTRHPDPDKRRFYRLNPEPDPNLVIRAPEGAGSDWKPPKSQESRPFLDKTSEAGDATGDGPWYWIRDDEGRSGKLIKRYLKKPALAELGGGVSKVRELRNDVAHNEPTPELMSEARARMRLAGLWTEDDRFLADPLVLPVLAELGVDRPAEVCEQLLETLRQRLRMIR